MGKAANRREQLFDRYTKNLRLIHPDAPDVIGCPICKCTLTRGDLLGDNPRVTLAHTFPRSRGGSKTCLSCGTCNNTIGSRFEAALSQERTLADWWNGRESLRVRAGGSHGDVALELHFSPRRETMEVREVKEQTNPRKWENIVAHPPTQESPLSFIIPTPDYGDLIVASIHSAFLHLFYHFGYEYVLHENTVPVRQLLLGKSDPWDFRQTVSGMVPSPKAPENLPEGVHILCEPEQSACFLVIQPLPDQIKGFRTVAMPGFRPNGKSGYSEMLQSGESLQHFRAVTLDQLPHITDRLTNPKYKGIGHGCWDRTFRTEASATDS